MILRRVFVAIAVSLLLARAVLETLGGAEATGFLAGNATHELDLVIGASYVLFHLASVIAVPILILGTAIDWALSPARPR